MIEAAFTVMKRVPIGKPGAAAFEEDTNELMRDQAPTDRAYLPLQVLDRIDQVCDRFEAAWEAGDRPRLEDFLDEIDDPHRLVFLRDLLAAEIAARRRRGERPTPEEYAALCPEGPGSILDLFVTTSSPRGDRPGLDPRRRNRPSRATGRLPHRAPDRPGRDGHRLPGLRRAARHERRPQDHAKGRSRGVYPFQARVPHPGRHLASQSRHTPRTARGRGDVVHHDGARRGGRLPDVRAVGRRVGRPRAARLDDLARPTHTGVGPVSH